MPHAGRLPARPVGSRADPQRGGEATLAVDGFRTTSTTRPHLLRDGAFAVTAPADGGLAAAAGPTGIAAMLELTDHAPLPLRRPVRSLVWIRGHLRAVPSPIVAAVLDVIADESPGHALLQANSMIHDRVRQSLLWLATESVVIADADGAEPVDVAALLAASPDPFCLLESEWLRHLDARHPEVVHLLASRLSPKLRRGRPRPLGVDRYGLRLRVEHDPLDGRADHDIRLAFTAPVGDPAGLGRAIRVLTGCPFLTGLHARRR